MKWFKATNPNSMELIKLKEKYGNRILHVYYLVEYEMQAQKLNPNQIDLKSYSNWARLRSHYATKTYQDVIDSLSIQYRLVIDSLLNSDLIDHETTPENQAQTENEKYRERERERREKEKKERSDLGQSRIDEIDFEKYGVHKKSPVITKDIHPTNDFCPF